MTLSTGAVIYEDNLKVAAGIPADYRSWLDADAVAIPALPEFTCARIWNVLVLVPAAGWIG